MKFIFIIMAVFSVWALSAYLHDMDLVRQAEKGTISFFSSDKLYEVREQK